METLIDENFLTGHLYVNFDEKTKTTIGRLDVYDTDEDEILQFVDSTKCSDEDTYNKNTGIKIIKLKLAKKYYAYQRKKEQLKVDKAMKILVSSQRLLHQVNNKTNHIDFELSKYF